MISKTKKLCNNAKGRSEFKFDTLDFLSPSIQFTKSAALNCYDDGKNLEGEEGCASIEEKKKIYKIIVFLAFQRQKNLYIKGINNFYLH